jgi:hypothetical protein
MNNWCICWLTAQRLYKSFGVKRVNSVGWGLMQFATRTYTSYSTCHQQPVQWSVVCSNVRVRSEDGLYYEPKHVADLVCFISILYVVFDCANLLTLSEIGCQSLFRIQLLNDRIYWRDFISTVLNLSYLQCLPFIVSLSTSDLSHINDSSHGIFRGDFRVQAAERKVN